MPSDVLQQLAAATGANDSDALLKKPNTSVEEPRILLVTTVDVGDGTSDRIEVRAGENPADVARAFCLRHSLPEGIIGPLAQHLEHNLRKAAASRLAGDSFKSLNSEQRTSGGGEAELDPPQHTKSPKLPQQSQPPADAPPSVGGGTATKQHLSFGSGMDDRVYQQLSSKLLDESQAPSARRGNWVNAAEVLSGNNSKRSSSNISNLPGAPYAYDKHTTSPMPSPRDSVHLRLYATAQERAARLEERRKAAKAEEVAAIAASRSSISWISAEMMRGRGAGGMYDNYGEMLYSEGVEALMARLKRSESERKAREDRELEGVTFAPAITKKAWELKQRERSSCSTLGAEPSLASAGDDYEKWQRLHMRGIRKATQERMDSLRAQREEAELAECTFKPRINKNSDSLMMERAETLKALNITHHEQLFADALRRQAKMEELQSWYPDGVTFQPQINKDHRAQEYLRRSWDRTTRQQGSGGSGAMSASVNSGSPGAPPPVVERLYAEASRKQAKLEAMRQVAHGPIDPVTNKPLYVPETGRGPRGSVAHARSRGNGRHIGEHLYQAAQDLAAKRAAIEEAERQAALEEAARSRTTTVSQRLFMDLKLKRFRQIFEYLDETGCGMLDLLAALGRSPSASDPAAPPGRAQRVEHLDGEVLLDVEAAATVWARANGLLLSNDEQRGNTENGSQPEGAFEQGTGDGSSTPRQSRGSAANSAAPGTPGRQASFGSAAGGGNLTGPCPPLSLEMFMSCMEEALRLRRGPRAYLVPSPSAKQAPAHTFKPAINPRSRALAAKVRPDTASTFELLHRVAAKTAERLEGLRREKEAAGMAGCTFRPQLNTNRNRTMKHSRSASHDPSAFAAAAAGIAAAAGPLSAAQAAEAERRDLQQQMTELRLAAETAVDMQAHLLAAAAHGEGGLGGGEGVDEELARFSLLEQELRDMQALTQVAIEDNDRQQQLMQAQAAQQQQRQRGVGAPAGGLQELAAVLGVSSWDGGAGAGGNRP